MAALDIPAPTAAQLCAVFEQVFSKSDSTRLVGGADEPFYRPAGNGELATVFFRADYVRSALHEVAHWCIAGPARRALPDYGYWYSPDDRDLPQQQAFFAVEAQPQAVERHFCEALDIGFSPSVDNLSLDVPESAQLQFTQRLEDWHARYSAEGLPARAARFHDALRGLRSKAAA